MSVMSLSSRHAKGLHFSAFLVFTCNLTIWLVMSHFVYKENGCFARLHSNCIGVVKFSGPKDAPDVYFKFQPDPTFYPLCRYGHKNARI